MNLSENLLLEEDLELLEPGDFIAIKLGSNPSRRQIQYSWIDGEKEQRRYFPLSSEGRTSPYVIWYFLSIRHEQPISINGRTCQAHVWLKFWCSELQKAVVIHLNEFVGVDVRKVI